MNAVSAWYLVWIAITTFVYWMVPARWRQIILICSTLILLALVSPLSLGVLCFLSLVTSYAIRFKSNQWTLIFAIFIAALLLLVKLSQQLTTADANSLFLIFGISFYTLRIIHVLLDHYLDKLNLINSIQLYGYLFFPPIIAAGPIQRIDTFKFSDNKFDSKLFVKGLEKILHGCAVVIVLYNIILRKLFFPWLNDLADNNEWHMPAREWISCFDYGFSLYLQFSAYSSIAIGFALLLGYQLEENFNWPFFRSSLVKFWRNWHISLSNFCRTYIFTGTLAFSRSAPLAFVASMLAIGLWHSTSINFILWGLYHGVGLILNQRWVSSRTFIIISERVPEALVLLVGWVITFNYVILGFAFTKHDTLKASMQSWARITGLG